MFFEKTKTAFSTWLEYLMDTIVKPVMNFSFTMVYMNVMDMILLNNVTFSKHSINGRGANLECPDNSSAFVCLINAAPLFEHIKILYNVGLKSVLLDIVMVFLFFVFSDKVLDDLEQISASLFKSISDPMKNSPSMTGSKGGGFGVENIAGQAFSSSMSAGQSLEGFRSTYVNNAPGALLDKVRRSSEASEEKRGGGGAIGRAIDKVGDKITSLENRAGRLKHNASRVLKQSMKNGANRVKELGSRLKNSWNKSIMGEIQAKAILDEANDLKNKIDKDSDGKDEASIAYKAKMKEIKDMKLSGNSIANLIKKQEKTLEKRQAKRKDLNSAIFFKNRRRRGADEKIKNAGSIIDDLRDIAAENLGDANEAKEFLRENMQLKKSANKNQKKMEKYNDRLRNIKNLKLSNSLIDNLINRGTELVDDYNEENDQDSENATREFIDSLNKMKK
jgi:hypothetical protein